MSEESLLKHLEFLQAVISRLASNSASVKTWAVTLTAALFALAAKDSKPVYFLIALFPLIAFWLLDAYYLRQERLYRALYDLARADKLSEDPLSMNVSPVAGLVGNVPRVALSRTLLGFYGPIIATSVITVLIALRSST